MTIIDILISMITWFFQKIILPILPVNLPLLSYENFVAILNGSVKHNLTWAFAGLNQFANLELLFILLMTIIFGEILFFLARVGIFIVKIIRG